MSNSLHIKGLSLRNGDFSILNEIDAEVKPGELTALIGPNGAGKSSLLKTLSGEYKDFDGQITWGAFHWKLGKESDFSKYRATLRQQYQMSFSFSVREIIEMGRYPHMTVDTVNKKIISEVVSYLDLDEFLSKKFDRLSGGEQQRVQLARVLAQIWDAPKEAMLLLDEPVSALDIRFQHQLLHLLSTLAKERNWIIISVLHDLNQVMQYVDHVILMKRGKILATGKPVEVMNPENLKESYHVNASWIHSEDFELPTIKIQYK